MKAETVKMLLAGINTLGLATYLVWLSLEGRERLFYSQEGVLFLLPCLPLFIVYILLFRKPREEGEAEGPSMKLTTGKKRG